MTKEEFKILGLVCLGTFLFYNSVSALHVAVPTIQREFGTNLAVIQWISIIGVVMISSLSLCFGRAGDILGRRKLYKVGLALYTLGSGLVRFPGTAPLGRGRYSGFPPQEEKSIGIVRNLPRHNLFESLPSASLR